MKKTFSFIDSLFKSPNFAIGFMITISVISIYGTLFPPKTPYDFNIYKTPFFMGLLLLFAIDIGYCTCFRIIKVYIGICKGKFEGKNLGNVKKDILEDFKTKGFKIKGLDDGYLITKGLFRTYSVISLHIFVILLIITAGISSFFGFLGTVNIYEKKGTDICFSWNEKKDVRLPFNIFINSSRVEYYPMPLKLEIQDLKNDVKKEFITKEGDIIDFNGVKLRILKGVVENKTIIFSVFHNDIEIGPFENEYLRDNISFKIKFLAYIDPMPRQFYADIIVNDRKGNTSSKIININNPMDFQGYKIYLIDIGRDDFGFPYVGLQITYEPLINIIWVICFFIILTLVIYPFVEGTYIRLKENGDTFIVLVRTEKLNQTIRDIIKSHEII